MTEEKYKECKELKEKIGFCKDKINQINSLINSCGLSCEITGTGKGSFSRQNPFVFTKRKEILSLLESEKIVIESALLVLNEKFDSL